MLNETLHEKSSNESKKNTVDKNEKKNHIYLLQEREFVRLNENTYTIGKTRKSKTRFYGYPKGSHIYRGPGQIGTVK
jgi:putative salt-induced outer membrane protein YdiY